MLLIPFVADENVSFASSKPTALITAWKPDAMAPPTDDWRFPALVVVDCDGGGDAELFGIIVSGRGGGEPWAVVPAFLEAVPVKGGVLLVVLVLLDVTVVPEVDWLGSPWLAEPTPLVLPPPRPEPPVTPLFPEPLDAEPA